MDVEASRDPPGEVQRCEWEGLHFGLIHMTEVTT